MILLLLAASASDPDLMMRTAQSRLAATCESGCAASPDARFRVDAEATSAVTSKDRAIGDDGSRCNVVGARRCTKHGRTIFRTDLSR